MTDTSEAVDAPDVADASPVGVTNSETPVDVFASGEALPDGFSDGVFAEMGEDFPEDTAALQQQWGSDAPANTAFARRALEQLEAASPGLVDEQIADGAVITPKLLSALSMVGRALAGTPGDPGSVSLDSAMREALMSNTSTGGAPAPQVQALQDKIDDITEKAWKSDSYYSSKVQRQLRPLYDKLHGTEPADGRGIPQ